MDTNKTIARMMGALYIIGTVAGILSRVVTGSLLSASDMLLAISANENRIVFGGFFVLTMGVVLTMIPVAAFPVLKKHNEILALGYVVFRGALEGITYMAIVVSWLLLLPLGQVYQAGTPEAADLQVWGKMLFETPELGVVLMLVFGLGGLMFYSLLYQTKLVPRWLSGWGVIALLLNFVAGFAAMFGLFTTVSTISTILQLPIFLQEMVLAVWLIVKGFKEVAA
jgi:hypothetical protein